MKNNKIIYVIIIVALVVIISITSLFIINNREKNNDDVNNNVTDDTSNNVEPTNLLEAVLKKNNKTKEEANYKKITNGEILNENTCFRSYAFISNNSIYIYNQNKLNNGEFEYEKIYDIPSNIKVMNIVPGFGADIKFIDYNDTIYTLQDDNLDNKVRDSYDMYQNAIYSLSSTLKWEYSTQFLGKKIDYDFMSNYAYSNDNILYGISYGNEKYPKIEKASGNYEGEKIIRIYNERILKTDKGFYEIIRYYDAKLNKEITTTMKMKLLSKYYDEVLTFTYKYVILKDYTLIPINDTMENRVRDYQDSYFISGFNSQEEIPTVFEE
mgnify:FL=1